MNEPINEGDACWIDFTLLDRNGLEPVTPPASLSYRIDCMTSLEEVLGDTPIDPPVTSGTITVTSQQNTLSTRDSPFELRQVQLTAVFGVGDEIKRCYHYRVNNSDGGS